MPRARKPFVSLMWILINMVFVVQEESPLSQCCEVNFGSSHWFKVINKLL